MPKFLKFVSNKTAFILAVTGAILVGGIASVVVSAAIPDSNGVIHACYRTSGGQTSGQLRVIDNATSICSSNETALNWNQSGPVTSGIGWSGYGYIKEDGTLDSSRSLHVTSVTLSSTTFSTYCIVTNVNPMLVSVSGANGSSGFVRGADPGSDSQIDSACDSSTQIMVSPGAAGTGIYFFFL